MRHLLCLVLLPLFTQAQNVGINTSTPTGPLSFNDNLGNKIVLWGNGNQSHYGLGIQNGTLQVYANQAADIIAFGHGRSAVFTERARIINNGTNGMSINGRIEMRNGTSPLNMAAGPGLSLFRADNAALLGLIGVQNNQNIGFFGGPAGWGMVYDAVNSRVGIGNDNPSFRLDITGRMRIRQGSDGEPGIWLNNNNNSAQAAFIGLQDNNRVGLFGNSGAGWGLTMNTATAALAVNGDYGFPDRVLTSNGADIAPSWSYSGNRLFVAQQTAVSQILGATGEIDLPGLTANITLETSGRVAFFLFIRLINVGCSGCGLRSHQVRLLNLGDQRLVGTRNLYSENGLEIDLDTGPIMIDLPAGTHSFKVVLRNGGLGSASAITTRDSQLSWVIYPK